MKSCEFYPDYQIGQITVRQSALALETSEGEMRHIQPKFLDVLNYLASKYPEVVTRQDIIVQVWPENAYVGEKALTNCIWNLRTLLNTEDNENVTIETIRKSGYRLLVKPIVIENTGHSNSLDAIEIETPVLENASAKRKVYTLALIVALTVCVVSILYLNIGNDEPLSYLQPTSKKVTKEPGREVFVAASPSGRYVAYKWINSSGASHLFISDRDQAAIAPQQLTFFDYDVGHSVWSSNEQFLYFSKKNVERGECYIIRLALKSKQQTILANCPMRGGYHYIDISPDDNTLAYYNQLDNDETSGIYFLDLAAPVPVPKRFSCDIDCSFKDRDMAFSPDGKYIAISRRSAWFNENIFLIELATSTEQQITFSENDIQGMSWHPNGNDLVYSSAIGGQSSGYIYSIDTGLNRPLNVDDFSYPSFARNTGELFYHNEKSKSFIAKIDFADGTLMGPTPLLKSDFSHHNPHYSDVSEKIAYISDESGFNEVWIANTDGTQRTQLTYLARDVEHPAWSSSGTRVAFISPSKDNNRDQIYVADIVTKEVNAITSQFSNHGRPSWNIDDSSVISAVSNNNRVNLFAFPLNNDEAQQLTSNGGRFGVMTQENTLIYSRLSGDLWVIENNQKPKQIISKNSLLSRYSWQYYDRSIYFQSDSSGKLSVNRFDMETSDMSTLTYLPYDFFERSESIVINIKMSQLIFSTDHQPQADISILSHPYISNELSPPK